MSILRYKQKLFADGGVLRGGDGGGGGGAPTQTTAYNTNIPAYAQPYVENMLGSTQAQIYNNDMTSFRPYQPYSTDVNNYFAGFSPLQQQAQQGAANMQQPGQYALGSGLAGASGIGALGAGQQYAQQAQDPNAMKGYMSPYMQNVVDYQKSQAMRDYQMGQPLMAKAATGQGAFGGNRLALQQSEAQRGLMSQLQGIEATGSQNAFQNAQQAQQFGANLGLQGYAQANQAAGTLGQLGSQQQASDIAMQNQQAAMGGQQQQLEQSKINQAIQNYSTAQQYPMLQLGMMSNMLRGLPMQSQTTQMYQAQPSTTQQAIGLLGAGSTLLGKKEGGIIGYKYGGAIPEPKLAGMAQNLSVEQLKQRLQDPQLDSGERQIFADALADKNKQSARSEGIAAAGGGLFDTMGYAGGGILAFADEGEVKDPQALADEINLVGTQLDAINKEASGKNAPGSRQKAFSPEKAAEYENLQKRQNELKNQYSGLMTKAGLDKPAVGYRSNLAPTTITPNATEQAVLGQKPPETTSAQPTEGEFNAFDEATKRYLTEQKAKNAPAGPTAGTEGSKAYGTAPTGGGVGTGSTSTLGGILANLRKEGPQGQVGEAYDKFLTERGADTSKLDRAEKMAIAKAFLKFGSTPAPGGIGQAAVAGLSEYATEHEKAYNAADVLTAETAKLKNDIDALRRAESRGDVKLASELEDKIKDRQNKIQTAQISASSAGASGRQEQATIDRVMKENPGMSYLDALQAVKGAGKVEGVDVQKAKLLLKDINEQIFALGADPKKNAAKIAELEQQRNAINQAMSVGGGTASASSGNVLRFDAQGNQVKG